MVGRCRLLVLVWLSLAAAYLLAQSRAPVGNKSAAQQGIVQGDATKGEQIYGARCAICHFSANTEKKMGPGLKGLYTRGKFADGKKVDDASVRAWIERGGKNMPGYRAVLSAEQIRDLTAYLKTL